MELNEFSLIYPTAKSKAAHESGSACPDVDEYTLEELGLLEVFSLKAQELSSFLTTDPEVMAYRRATFSDLVACPELSELFSKLVPVLEDIKELRRLEADAAEEEDYLSSLTEIELYVSSVEILWNGLSKAKDRIKSPAFTKLYDLVEELSQSDYYQNLNKHLQELTSRVREIRSVTIGVNLDSRLEPTSAGVLSINPEPFKSGDVLDKILRLSFKNDPYTCIANLAPFSKGQTENEKTALSTAFHNAINQVYRSSLHSWKKIVQEYVLENTEFLLRLSPEFEFLAKGRDFLTALQEKGLPLSTPTLRPMEENAFFAKGLYNPVVALKAEGEMVPNDLSFDENARIFVLTGPNRGGKSVITCALGLSFVMLQLGMPVPAESATLSPVDGIYTHFPTGADDTIDKGRLGEECARLGEIFDAVTPYSLVLLDESLSSTGSFEASYIASEVLLGFSKVGCRTLFSTHLHELAARVPELNERAKAEGGFPIDTLVAGMEEDRRRSFVITRAKPDGKSYAGDIAKKYGLTYEDIQKRIQK
ncbi:MAG: hypothetical protein IJR88_04325 [Clostridia bacterium]|nr:hypothetical protein [Clostridia bacterium]